MERVFVILPQKPEPPAPPPYVPTYPSGDYSLSDVWGWVITASIVVAFVFFLIGYQQANSEYQKLQYDAQTGGGDPRPGPGLAPPTPGPGLPDRPSAGNPRREP